MSEFVVTDPRGVQRTLDAAKPGDVVALGPGVFQGPLVIESSITLRGAGADQTTIDGHGMGAVISIDDGQVVIEDLCLTGGSSSFGGGLSVDNGARVDVARCLFEANAAPSGVGGAVAVDQGYVFLVECTLRDNEAVRGGALHVGGQGQVALHACIAADNTALQGGALAVVEGARLEALTCRFDYNRAHERGEHLFTAGSRSLVPEVLLSNCILGACSGVPISSSRRGRVELDHTMVVADPRTRARVFA